ncbi:hypothetical protein RBI13_09735 [Alcaligenaceae bacterium A4P071]|jgi:hypothetical protein|uniref:hypothetical protein n=1 Tax=Schauerella aestuarii TaxID=2511204 RepID=UPI001368B597|nr:hypothetical protein [Achromobacter aestuarii]MDQ2137862.1 hypothetical protein [Alcaligenaceae bacterium B3P038]MDQ2148140.1 hypothetical protein [Alcaligenaceae bacterium C4P045]MDQ2185467.1 hypothetical protein [Alcaligenaceae bacterium A4P071]MYZ44172.1 hypothetical protein [Achromobacter aestuarii]
MNRISYDQNIRLTDTLERDLLRGAMQQQNDLRPMAALKAGALAAVAAFSAFVSFVRDVNASMDDARQKSTKFTNAQW